MEKIIHIVGAGVNQIPLISKAKNFGYKVLITDMFKNPPARKYADYFFQINTRDKEATLAIAKKYNISAITTDATDVAIPTVSYVAEKLKLNAICYEAAIYCTNKFEMRKKLISLKENMPEFFFIKTIEEAKKFDYNSFKYIIKPSDSQGSKGVFTIKNFEEDKFQKCFEETKNGIMLEEYIEGEQYSLESIVVNSEITLLAITKIEFFPHKHIAKKLSYLKDIPENIENILKTLNYKVINTLAVNNTLIHAEYRIKNNKAYLIEVACRGGGGGISSIALPYLTGLDIPELILKFSLNKQNSIQLKNSEKSLQIEFFDFKLGKIERIDINDKINEVAYYYFLDDIQEIKNINNSRDRYGYFVIEGQTLKEIEYNRQKVYEYIIPIYEE